MRGFELTINAMIGIILVLIIFVISLGMMISIMQGGRDIWDAFCQKNPEWCGLKPYPDCVCCEVRATMKLGWPFKDIDDVIYVWATEDECIELIKANDGAMYYDQDKPGQEKCGPTNTSLIEEGIIFKDRCVVPERWVGATIPDCICCQYSPEQGLYVFEWDVSWRCRERQDYQIVNETTCGPLYLMPPETREQLDIKLGRSLRMGKYCEIPYPYNMTTPP